jgi:hypothetical protein
LIFDLNKEKMKIVVWIGTGNDKVIFDVERGDKIGSLREKMVLLMNAPEDELHFT